MLSKVTAVLFTAGSVVETVCFPFPPRFTGTLPEVVVSKGQC